MTAERPQRDSTGWPTLVTAFAFGLAAFVVWFCGLRLGNPMLWSDSYEYAQVARNVAEGWGLRTNALLVRELSLVGADELPAPYFLHDPGHALLIGFVFRLFGASNATLAWATGVAFALACALAAALARLLFGSPAGFIAGILVATSTPLLSFSTTGLSEATTACALTTFLLLLMGAGRSRFGLFLTGLAYGGTVLIRSNTLPFLPYVLAYAALGAAGSSGTLSERARGRGLATALASFLLGFFLVLGPSAVRNYRSLGHPLFSVAGAVGLSRSLVTEDPLESATPIPPALSVLARPGPLLYRAQQQIVRALAQLFSGGYEQNSIDATFLLIFLFVAFAGAPAPEDARRRHFRWLLLACIVTAILVGSLFQLRWRHLYGFVPAAAALVAGVLAHGFAEASQGPGSYRLRLAACFAASVTLGFAPLLSRPLPDYQLEMDRVYRALALFLRQQTEASAVVLVDATPPIPMSALAWYGERFYVSYSAYSLERLHSIPGGRPVYYLKVRFRPTAAHLLGAPEPPPGFLPLAKWNDRPGTSQAWLMGRRRP